MQQTIHIVQTLIMGDVNTQHVLWWRNMRIHTGYFVIGGHLFLRAPTVQSRGRQTATCDPRRHFVRLSLTRTFRFRLGSLNYKSHIYDKSRPLRICRVQNRLLPLELVYTFRDDACQQSRVTVTGRQTQRTLTGRPWPIYQSPSWTDSAVRGVLKFAQFFSKHFLIPVIITTCVRKLIHFIKLAQFPIIFCPIWFLLFPVSFISERSLL
jgi:hypothetical protein